VPPSVSLPPSLSSSPPPHHHNCRPCSDAALQALQRALCTEITMQMLLEYTRVHWTAARDAACLCVCHLLRKFCVCVC
jgi:hypothetical protein